MKVEGLGRLNRNMFVVEAKGKSMEPKIPDGSFFVFRANVVGSRHNKIMLVHHRGFYDPDLDGGYTIKTYTSEKSYDQETGQWQHERIILKPLNAGFQSIILNSDESFMVVGEFVGLVS